MSTRYEVGKLNQVREIEGLKKKERHNYVTTSFFIPAEIKEKVELVAKANGCSVAAVYRIAVDDLLKKVLI